MLLKHLKLFDKRLFLALFITGIIPTLYITVRFNYLGNIPDAWGYNIASQLQYINLMFEVMQEMLVLPLFYLIGKTIHSTDETKNKIKTGLLGLFIIFFIFSLITAIFAYPLVELMAQSGDLIDATVTYIRYELVGLIFSNSVKFFMVVLILLNLRRQIYVTLFVQMAVKIILDTLFISDYNFSLSLGVNGIAYTNILVNMFLFIYLTVLLIRHFRFSLKELVSEYDFTWFKEWLKVGGFSGLESFVRNLAFTIMILRMVNMVSEQGTYWIANTFAWSWMLLPVLTLGELIKKETSQGNHMIMRKTMGYFIVTTIFVVFWLGTLPLWTDFLGTVMNVGDPAKVFNVLLLQLVFYILFAYNNIMDSTFYGVGRTDYMLYQSLTVNFFFYGGAYILYRMGIFIPSLESIALLFGLGMFFDFIPTLILYIKLYKDRSLSIQVNVE